MIPKVLQEVAQAITDGFTQLPFGGADPRGDSMVAESVIVAWLLNRQRWNITSPNIDSTHNRSWYDLKIDGLYCDIKVSKLRGNDNTNAKKAVYYLLTGKDPDGVSNQHSRFFKAMRENENEDEERDFYFIVVSKLDRSAFIVSLKGIAELTPSSNNPPFQCKWDNCRAPTQRTWQQARQFLLECWAASIQKGIAIWKNGMPAQYPGFFE